jgi:hypothetical protein
MDINDFNENELLELFDLNSDYNGDELNESFINLFKKYNNINNRSAIKFIKEAYNKLKDELFYEHFENKKNNISNNNILNNNISNDINLSNNNVRLVNNHDIINKPSKIGKNSVDLEYASSNLNNVRRDVVFQSFNIDSTFRKLFNDNSSFIKNVNLNNNLLNSIDTSDFIYEFISPVENVISYKITSIELPNLWYTFSSLKRNNEFTIEVYNYNDGSGNFLDSSHTIIIPDGNYNSSELYTIINNYFNNKKEGLDFLYFEINEYDGSSIFRAKDINDVDFASSPKPFEGDASCNNFFSPNFTFYINFDLEEDQNLRKQQNNILTTKSKNILNDNNICTYNDEDLRILNLNLRDFEKNCGYTLGFRKYEYLVDASDTFYDLISNDSTPITYKCFLKSESYYGDSVNRYLYLDIDDFNNNYKNSFVASRSVNFIRNNIIAKIPITNGSFTMVYNNNSDEVLRERVFFGPVSLNKLRIRLLDKYGELINMKNSNYSMTLEIKQIYS